MTIKIEAKEINPTFIYFYLNINDISTTVYARLYYIIVDMIGIDTIVEFTFNNVLGKESIHIANVESDRYTLVYKEAFASVCKRKFDMLFGRSFDIREEIKFNYTILFESL
jgi:hypothetical protein